MDDVLYLLPFVATLLIMIPRLSSLTCTDISPRWILHARRLWRRTRCPPMTTCRLNVIKWQDGTRLIQFAVIWFYYTLDMYSACTPFSCGSWPFFRSLTRHLSGLKPIITARGSDGGKSRLQIDPIIVKLCSWLWCVTGIRKMTERTKNI